MIDKNKVYKTRDGREVRVFMTDGGDWRWPVIAAYRDADGRWWPLHCTKDGLTSLQAGGNCALDLIEVKPRIKREVWVNIYRGREIDWMTIHDERDEADDYPDHHKTRIACVRLTIDCEEGDGL